MSNLLKLNTVHNIYNYNVIINKVFTNNLQRSIVCHFCTATMYTMH